mmetsp:Transcript_30603/g.46305  ORF Transcript_30603/g.46305 Transcript_30603/m.46305 type:complete len:1119 (-) Transcript_30603:2392-5748(-)
MDDDRQDTSNEDIDPQDNPTAEEVNEDIDQKDDPDIEEIQKTVDRRKSQRPDRLNSLIQAKRVSTLSFYRKAGEDEDVEQGSTRKITFDVADSEEKNGLGIETGEKPTQRRGEDLLSVHRRFSEYTRNVSNKRFVQVRMENFSYSVPVPTDRPHIPTVRNQNIFYSSYLFLRRIKDYCKSKRKGNEIFVPYTHATILNNVSLCLSPGNAYLVLGPPGCGKTTLLKAIAGRLPHSDGLQHKELANKPYITGKIKFNGLTVQDDPNLVLPSIVSYVGQYDVHAPYLTVEETFGFAFDCLAGGNHTNAGMGNSKEGAKEVAAMDKIRLTENLTIEGLDLAHVRGTFVGNDDVRGVSGGQRRRVTIGEVMVANNPVACADEISTGLDAAVTSDIIRSIVTFTRAAMTTRIVALLQPGPETFSQFDGVIVLAKGNVIYSGPIDDVVEYFSDLGYELPATMDVADFLQLLPTEDGAAYFDHTRSKRGAIEHYTPEGFAEAFQKSSFGQNIRDELTAPHPHTWIKSKTLLQKATGAFVDEESKKEANSEQSLGSKEKIPKEFRLPHKNSFFRSMVLNFNRYIILWKRDKGFIIGKLAENFAMASSIGGILFNGGNIGIDTSEGFINDPDAVDTTFEKSLAIYGVFFLALWHLSQGTTINASDELAVRTINYKHIDANFFQTASFAIGRTLSTLPQKTLEIMIFAIPVYFLFNLNRTAAGFFIFLAIVFTYNFAIYIFYSVLSNLLPDKGTVQGVGITFLLLMAQFGGFIVYPDAIPVWYEWLYWINPFGWAMQALVANEFQIGTKYDGISVFGVTGGAFFVNQKGFIPGGERVGFSFAFLVPFTVIFVFILTIVLKKVRYEGTKINTVKDQDIDEKEKKKSEDVVSQSIVTQLPFTRVDLTFKNITYDVVASTTGETLKLLKNVNGFMKAGRMCALVGSSGAGKTTLMDVISLRKTSGNVGGEVRLNGFLQERESFLRCAAYVEQFDIQSPELTVRETVLFSAKLRLDPSIEATAKTADKERFVDGVLNMLELTVLKDSQVGSYEAGGLTFEQRKRLAIAVEFAGSPSILFLDEVCLLWNHSCTCYKHPCCCCVSMALTVSPPFLLCLSTPSPRLVLTLVGHLLS